MQKNADSLSNQSLGTQGNEKISSSCSITSAMAILKSVQPCQTIFEKIRQQMTIWLYNFGSNCLNINQ